MRIELLDSAEKDLLNGFKFYERQSKGLGDYFLNSLFSDIESLYLYAGIHALHFGYHRLLCKRFPFAIYYRLQKGHHSGLCHFGLSPESRVDSK